MEKQPPTFHPWRVRAGFLILVAGVSIAFVQQGRLTARVNAKDNATRCEVVALVKRLSDNAARNYAATEASPIATRDQKRAAALNLNQIKVTLRTTADVLGHPVGSICALDG